MAWAIYYGRPASSRCAHPELDCDDSNGDIGGGTAEVCDDGVDNDCDGFTDCSDFDCASNANCAGTMSCELS